MESKNKKDIVHLIRYTKNNWEDVIKFLKDHGLIINGFRINESNEIHIMHIDAKSFEGSKYIILKSYTYLVSTSKEVLPPNKTCLTGKNDITWFDYFNIENKGIVNMIREFKPDVIVSNNNFDNDFEKLDNTIRYTFVYEDKINE